MRKKKRRRNVPWVLIVVVVVLALAAGYTIGTRGAKQNAGPPLQVPEPVVKQPPNQPPEPPEVPMLREKIHPMQETLKVEADQERCAKLEKDLKYFFEYLNQRPYVRQVDPDADTREWFNRILAKLAAATPIPAGEALDTAAMTNHIFYFFRTLEIRELKLLKDVLANEASTLEANMELFFRWFFLNADCAPSNTVRPPPGVLYAYAGFFLNTIGGRAYLSRSSHPIRDLVTYYCLLILNDADRKGKNSYGIDIAPQVRALSKEMAYNKDLLFQEEYTKRLAELKEFYAGR